MSVFAASGSGRPKRLTGPGDFARCCRKPGFSTGLSPYFGDHLDPDFVSPARQVKVSGRGQKVGGVLGIACRVCAAASAAADGSDGAD
jgi:hypothetical protein